MKPKIKTQDLGQEFYTEEGCYITEISNSTDDPELSIARARVKPGVTTQWHHLVGTAERYVILSGEGLVELEQQPAQKVKTGDVVLIPPGCRQRIRNLSNEDLLFLAICTPCFKSEAYFEGD